MNFKDLRSAVVTTSLTADEIRELWDLLKVKHESLVKMAAMSFKKGQKVKFKNSRTGEIVVGVVAKITAKSVHIDAPNCKWRVSPNLVSAA